MPPTVPRPCAAFCLPGLVLLGCSAAPGGDLHSAVPLAAELRIQPPEARTPSQYWALSQQLAAQLNRVIGDPLDLVARITSNPPTATDGSRAVWVPPPDARVAHRLVVDRVSAHHSNFALLVKPVAAGDDAFQPFLAGSLEESGGRRAGALVIDLTLLHGLDPDAEPDAGHLAAQFDVGADARLEVQLDGVGSAPTSGTGFLARGADGSGGLELQALSNFTPGPALESAHVAARWSPAHDGRAEVQIRGGDAGAGADSLECWDAAAERLFFAFAPVGGPTTHEGDPAACMP